MKKSGGSPADNLENSNHDPFGTKVNELWSMTIDKGSRAGEKLDDLLESITDTLLQLEWKLDRPSWLIHCPLEMKEPVIEKLFEISMKIIDSPNEFGTAETRCKYQFSARQILNLIAKNLDCDQTKLLYNTCIGPLKMDPRDKQYSKELVGFSACCLTRLNYEHVLTKEQAGDLTKELIPLASRAYIAESFHLDPDETHHLLVVREYLYPEDMISSNQVDYLYPRLNGFLFSLVRYSGFYENFEYAKSVFSDAESKGIVGGELMVVLNILVLEDEAHNIEEICENPHWDRVFELSEITIRLMNISGIGFIRAHLVYVFWKFLRRAIFCHSPMYGGHLLDVLMDHFISRHDDKTADRLILYIFSRCLYPPVDDYLRYLFTKNKNAMKEKFEKLNLDEEFAEYLGRFFNDPDD